MDITVDYIKRFMALSWLRRLATLVVAVISLLMPCGLQAQEIFRPQHGNCMPDLNTESDGTPPSSEGVGGRSGGPLSRRLPAINTEWDANRTYRQLVILVEFSDVQFTYEDPRQAYDKIMNEPGYNERKGLGCVADYFRSQSRGLFNLQFDVFGPYQTSGKAKVEDTSNTNYGRNAFYEAADQFLKDNPDLDYSVYDWNGNGYINQVIFIFAGYTGNSGGIGVGCVWPNTSSFKPLTTPDGLILQSYSASAELWPSTTIYTYGIGTICHEFSHSLGLPDIYPVNEAWTFTAVDEWDLMDGGNFTNFGWCPCNMTALEKMLMGWLTPIELTEPTSITGMKTLEDGGDAYIIRHTDTEYLLLENRQWKGWDLGVPGKGLVIYHVNFDAQRWRNNSPNGVKDRFNFSLVSADNMDYYEWDSYAAAMHYPTYQNKTWMNKYLLSTSPYPWATDSTTTVLDSLTARSVPSTRMYNFNAEGSRYLAHSVTNITQSADGLISFDLVAEEPFADVILPLGGVRGGLQGEGLSYYDLQGRPLSSPPISGLYLLRLSDGTFRKVLQ